MRWLRWVIVVLGALALAMVAMGAGGAGPGSAGPGSAGSARANRRAAERDAARLFAHVVLPAGATVSAGEPAGDHHYLSRPGQVPAAVNVTDRHGWWTVPEDPALVSAFVGRHQPKGTHGVIGGVGDGPQFSTESVAFELGSTGQAVGTRWLVVAMTNLPGDQTGVRVDAEVQWLIPRPPGERIPSSARVLEVTVRRPHRRPISEVSVTRVAQVRRIASLIDGLKTEQPGAMDCTGRADDPVVTFTFRAVLGGRVLARATQIVDGGAGRPQCEPMTLTVRGRPQTPLLDGATVVRSAQRLLGIRVPRG